MRPWPPLLRVRRPSNKSRWRLPGDPDVDGGNVTFTTEDGVILTIENELS